MTTIDTSTAATATAYSNQRKIDRCQNGVLWKVHLATTAIFEFHYSTDDGATWTEDTSADINTGGDTYVPNGSFFIDLDDYAHFVYKDGSDGYIYYVRGTPNAGRTAWTWSSAVVLRDTTPHNYPDLVAHRNGTGWSVHVVWSATTATDNYVYYNRLTIASDGTPTDHGDSGLAGTYSNANTTWPSIDFNHTGDGKTVAGGTPHLYVAWSAGAAGAGLGIRFKKATYSDGSWTWGTEREIDSTRYIEGPRYYVNCLFDGTRVIIAGMLWDGAADDILLYERDAADTTTTTRELLANAAAADRLDFGSVTYDSDGNVYIFGRDNTGSAGSHKLNYRKWVRATTTLDAIVTIESSINDAPYVSVKRGWSEYLIEFIYTDGTASPYNVVYGSITLNVAPNTPTALTVTSTSETDTTPNFSLEVTDPNSGDQIKGRFEIQTAAGAAVGTIDSSFRTGDGTVTAEYNSALSPGNYRVRATALDDDGEQSGPTDWVEFRVTTAVTPKEINFLWGVYGNFAVDTTLLWDVAKAGQKDFTLLWQVGTYVPVDLETEWLVKTPWTPVQDNETAWERVY